MRALAATLARGRAQAESRMTSRVKIRRESGRTTQDEGSGEEVPVWDVVHRNLPFRLGGSSQGGTGTRTVKIGDDEFQQALRVAHVPACTEDLADGDYIEVTAGENVGRVLRIVEATWQDQATARRMPVIEVERPGGW